MCVVASNVAADNKMLVDVMARFHYNPENTADVNEFFARAARTLHRDEGVFQAYARRFLNWETIEDSRLNDLCWNIETGTAELSV